MNEFCPSAVANVPWRWVGDPVDIVTGEQFDVALDFRVAWTFPFEWRRYYSTARCHEPLPIGWGHTHAYDHRLLYDVDGLLYIDPTGTRHPFPEPQGGSPFCVTATGSLRRLGPHWYRVKVRSLPECEFRFVDPARPAQLQKIFKGRAFHELRYSADGKWREIAFRDERPIHVDSEMTGRVAALLWKATDKAGERVLWEAHYDAGGNAVKVIDPYRAAQTFAYDSAHRMIRRTDRRGYGFGFAYDPAGRCVRSAGEDGVQEVKLRYLQAEGVTVVTRADGGEWQYFHQLQRPTRVVDPYGGVRQWFYRDDGKLEREVGPMGEILQAIQDEESGATWEPLKPSASMCFLLGDPWFGHVRRLYLPADAMGWDGWGESRCRNAIRLPLAESGWLHQLPREVARCVRVASRPEESQSASSVLSGRKAIGVPDRPGVMQYDSFGQLVSHADPSGHSARWMYDANGNVVRYTDYAGAEWRYEYQSWNHLVREIDPLGNRIAYAYNLLEKPIRTADPGGTATEQTFDLKDRLAERRRHAALRDSFAYDLSEGMIEARTDATPARVTFKQGPWRRPIEIKPKDQPPRRCNYNDKGRLAEVASEDGETLQFAYGPTGQRTADLRNGQGVRRQYAASRVQEIAVLGKFIAGYQHHAKTGRTTITDPLGGRHFFQPLHPSVYLRQLANGVEELSQFDWNGRCLRKARFHRDQPGRVWSGAYTYSPVGALMAVEDTDSGVFRYQYDAAHRLESETQPDGVQRRYQYDPAGNLLKAPGLEGVSCAQNRLTAANGRQFEYNERHHVTREHGGGVDRRFAYDAEDRLVRCRIDGLEVSFRYDALGRRVSKTTLSGRTEFIWDGERLAAEVAPAGELRVYLYSDADALTPFAFVDYARVDAAPDSGKRRYIFSNQISCPVRVEDDAGNVLWQAEIEPCGRARIKPGAKLELNLRWPGHYFDPETSLHYNRYRYYSPELGRYIQVDPRDLEGGINVYAYSARPLDEVDVDGLAPCPKKAMITPAEDDKAFQQAKERADAIAENLRQAINEAGQEGDMHPQAAAGTTLATLVIVRQDGTYEVVVTGNRSDARLPPSVIDAMDGARFIGHGDDSPPRITQSDSDWRYERDNPRTGEREPTTHNHAEQRGLRATDCDPDTRGVAYVAPTRPCCEGCSTAIQTPHSDGGWGGSEDNVSSHGQRNW